MSKIVLSLGSNIGESKLKLADNLKRAIHLLKEKVSKIVTSSLYETSAVDHLHQANFLNQVALGETNLLPLELLSFVKGIEKKMKSKKLIPKGPRIIDIDLIFFNGLKINQKGLTIPHPEFSKRLFVLLPPVRN